MSDRRSGLAICSLFVGVLLVTACGDGASDASAPTIDSSIETTTTAQSTTTTDEVTSTTDEVTSTTEDLPPATAAVALMPDVRCQNLQDAQDEIQRAGVFFSRSDDATGQGRSQIIDSNWVVVDQRPAPGTPIGEGDAVLSVVKYGEESSVGSAC